MGSRSTMGASSGPTGARRIESPSNRQNPPVSRLAAQSRRLAAEGLPMPADRNDSISPRHRRKLFAVWFALFLFMVVGLGTTTGLAANGNGANNSNGNPGHTPDANHGGSQQGDQ